MEYLVARWIKTRNQLVSGPTLYYCSTMTKRFGEMVMILMMLTSSDLIKFQSPLPGDTKVM